MNNSKERKGATSVIKKLQALLAETGPKRYRYQQRR